MVEYVDFWQKIVGNAYFDRKRSNMSIFADIAQKARFWPKMVENFAFWLKMVGNPDFDRISQFVYNFKLVYTVIQASVHGGFE